MTIPSGKDTLSPGLYFVATPIGNARDITLRALDILASADVLAAEDTRRLRQLMEIHGISPNGRKILAYHDHNGPKARPALIQALKDGKSVAYASDAGTPLVADPGFALARDAIAQGQNVLAAPGASAVLAALAVSGLPSDRFTFAGFLPSAPGARARALEDLGDAPGTLIFYESPKRIAAMLAEACRILGPDRPAVMARELTKKFEETRRGSLTELCESIEKDPPRGEIVVLIAPGEKTVDPAMVEQALRDALETQKLKDAARDVAERFGLSRRHVYQMGLSLN